MSNPALYYLAGPPCSCHTVTDDCAGCVHARYTAFLRGWSWVAAAFGRRSEPYKNHTTKEL